MLRAESSRTAGRPRPRGSLQRPEDLASASGAAEPSTAGGAGPASRRGPRRSTNAALRYPTREDLFRNEDPDEKHKLTQRYNEQIQNVERLQREGIADANKMMDIMVKGDELHLKVKSTETAAVDSRFLTMMTEVASEMIYKLKSSSAAYDVDGLLRTIESKLGLDVIARQQHDDELPDGPEDELDHDAALRRQEALLRYADGEVLGDWAALGWRAAKFYRRVPGVEFMYGPLAVEHQKRTVQRRPRQKEVEPETRPEEIAPETQNKSKDVTTQMVRLLEKLLRKSDPHGRGINFFKFIVNPFDFGQTVENAFYTSFLIGEGYAGINQEESGEIMIYHIARTGSEANQHHMKQQAVVELTMQDWEDAIRIFGIKRSMIPNRAKGASQPNWAQESLGR